MRFWLVVFILMSVVACGGEGGGPILTATDEKSENSSKQPDGASGTADISTPDLNLEEYRGAEPGSFGWPCFANDDCIEGLCVESLESFVCTQSCTD